MLLNNKLTNKEIQVILQSLFLKEQMVIDRYQNYFCP
jgi:hypothetical protein